MLIEFTVGNYLSFKEKKTLSMEATAIKDNPGNVTEVGKYKLLRSAVIYGANSSGKSNFIKAMSCMREIVIGSAKESSTSELEVTPFLLSTETENRPTYFEILLLIRDVRYRYGFETDKKNVHSEWLYSTAGSKEKLLFIRERDSIEITENFAEGVDLEERTRDNALFLSVVDQFNGSISKDIVEWFGEQIIFSGLDHEKEKNKTSLFLGNKHLNSSIKSFLSPLDLGFKDFTFDKLDKINNRIITFHNKFDNEGNILEPSEFELQNQESSGTNKLFDIAGSLVGSLILGNMVIIDELDAKLHPLLTISIIKLFNSPEQNLYNAQLIFATHDTNLLNKDLFRRDQIYFTEKNRFEETDLYSLAEYRDSSGKKARNDATYEKDYIAGRYGAIPYLGDFSKLINDGEKGKD